MAAGTILMAAPENFRRPTLRPIAEGLLFGLLFVLAATRGVRFGGDSPSYIAGEVYRSPGYVLLLRAYQDVFGGDFRWLAAAQIALGIAASWLFGRHLAR